MNKLKILWIISFCAFVIFTGCSSHSESPIVPAEKLANPAQEVDESENRTLWGIWDLTFDQASMEIDVQPSREGMVHFNITSMMLPPECSDCLDLNVYSFDPVTRILEVSVTLVNPTGMTGYDVRGILYSNDYGHRLLNSDGYTDFWDVPGGGLQNPFRIFESTTQNPGVFDAYGYVDNWYYVYIPGCRP